MLRLKELREEKGVSQKELAKKLGVAQNTVSNWENGNREADYNTLIQIANLFNTSIDFLIDDNAKETSTSTDVLLAQVLKGTNLVDKDTGCVTNDGIEVLKKFIQNNKDVLNAMIEIKKSSY